MKSVVLVLLVIAITALVESSPRIGYNRVSAIPDFDRSSLRTTRFKRSPNPEPQGAFNAGVQGNSLNLGYRHNIFDNNHGALTGSASAQITPQQNWNTNVGLQGTYRLPQPISRGSVTASWQQSLNGPERRPSFGVGYEHTLFQNRHGSVGATVGAQKFPGQNWQPNFGLGARFRFRRSPESDFKDQIDPQD